MATSGEKRAKKSKGEKSRPRNERRFSPNPAAKPVVVQAVGGVASAILGAGVWAHFGHQWTDSPLPPYPFAPVLLALGAAGLGASVWLGTSGEAVLRVGAGGVGIEKSKDVIRIPWYAVERVTWDPDRLALSVTGRDELGQKQNLTLTTKVHPAAIAWIVKEGRARVPDVVDVPDEAHGLPAARPDDGELLVMDPVQVVGRRCAATDRVIAYEPDARVCPQCERVYYKTEVPETCACGASLARFRPETDGKSEKAEKTEGAETAAGSST